MARVGGTTTSAMQSLVESQTGSDRCFDAVLVPALYDCSQTHPEEKRKGLACGAVRLVQKRGLRRITAKSGFIGVYL